MQNDGVKYQRILEMLRHDLATGKYVAGERLPSEHALADRFGVSRPTAGRALKELHIAGLVDRRPGSGTYARGHLSAPVAHQTHSYGLLAHGLGGTEILDPICTEITRTCQHAGSTVLWGVGSQNFGGDQIAELTALCKYYVERHVEGVFFAPLEHVPDRQAENLRIATTLQDAGVAVVLLDRDVMDFPGRGPFDIVGIDNFHAGFALGTHLAQDGHHTYTFVARPHFPATTDLRAAGVREALHRLHIDVPDYWQCTGEPTDKTFVSTMFKRHPDAIICSNDYTAALLIRTLDELGFAVPKDVAVVGFDDVRYSTLLPVSLTTIRQPCRAIATAAVRVMRQRLDDPATEPHQLLLDAELVTRQSCGHTNGADTSRDPVSGEEYGRSERPSSFATATSRRADVDGS